jgi:hypothetical protein
MFALHPNFEEMTGIIDKTDPDQASNPNNLGAYSQQFIFFVTYEWVQ